MKNLTAEQLFEIASSKGKNKSQRADIVRARICLINRASFKTGRSVETVFEAVSVLTGIYV